MQWLLTIAGAAAVGTVVKFYTEKVLEHLEALRADQSPIECFMALPRWGRVLMFVAFVLIAGAMFYSA